MKKINLVQTGGTIAMDIGGGRPELNADRWTELLHTQIPELSQLAEIHVDKLFFEDSSDINAGHWTMLIKHLSEHLDDYDGFVVLHGTDTMAYSASAVSFGLRNPGKPIIFTGSQVPLRKLRSDARRNLVNAVELAAGPCREVSICFNDHLYRANRATKMSIGDFDAFDSPNFPPLARIGLDIDYHLPESGAGPRQLCTKFGDQLILLKLYPNLRPERIEALITDGLQVVILEAFGSGNFPMRGEYNLLPLIRRCRNSGIQIVITSQAPYDSVDLDLYESGRAALEAGAVSAGDMTAEAALTKSMHLLGKGVADERFKTQFEANLAGERTAPPEPESSRP